MTIDENVMGQWQHMLGNPTGSALAGIGQIQRRGERDPTSVQTIKDSREAYLIACQELLLPEADFKDYHPTETDLNFLQRLYEKAQQIDWEVEEAVRELSESLRNYTGYKGIIG
ncbi:MAG TPA: hypothetical protein VJB90_06260 [Candidatus Nanoarchaeia archaeon]|nr:hypothetical protein [Candidatus Nanoarchaeia archaeon]